MLAYTIQYDLIISLCILLFQALDKCQIGDDVRKKEGQLNSKGSGSSTT